MCDVSCIGARKILPEDGALVPKHVADAPFIFVFL
jgi:hypothetical protein